MTPGAAAAVLLGVGERRVVLASGSPRRSDLLAGLGLDFDVVVPEVSEDPPPGAGPGEAAAVIAERKARAVAVSGGPALVIAADTIVVVDGELLGKPEDGAEARRMLVRLAGREHEVVTGVAVGLHPEGTVVRGTERTAVRFRPLVAAEIESLVVSGDWRGKAGGYGIQGLGSLVVDRLAGDYFNVVGLPLVRLGALIREATAGKGNQR